MIHFTSLNMNSNAIRLITILLPLIGLICQVYYIADAYVAFASVTQVTQLRQEKIEIPVFVFCVDYLDSSQNWTNETFKASQFPTPRSRLNRFKSLNNSIDDFQVYI